MIVSLKQYVHSSYSSWQWPFLYMTCKINKQSGIHLSVKSSKKAFPIWCNYNNIVGLPLTTALSVVIFTINSSDLITVARSLRELASWTLLSFYYIPQPFLIKLKWVIVHDISNNTTLNGLLVPCATSEKTKFAHVNWLYITVNASREESQYFTAILSSWHINDNIHPDLYTRLPHWSDI